MAAAEYLELIALSVAIVSDEPSIDEVRRCDYLNTAYVRAVLRAGATGPRWLPQNAPARPRRGPLPEWAEDERDCPGQRLPNSARTSTRLRSSGRARTTDRRGCGRRADKKPVLP
jgi:hypothetical protein